MLAGFVYDAFTMNYAVEITPDAFETARGNFMDSDIIPVKYKWTFSSK